MASFQGSETEHACNYKDKLHMCVCGPVRMENRGEKWKNNKFLKSIHTRSEVASPITTSVKP